MSDDGISDNSDYYSSEQSDYGDGDGDGDEEDQMMSKKAIGKKSKTYSFAASLKRRDIDDAMSDDDDDNESDDEEEALVGRVKQRINVSDDEDDADADADADADTEDDDNNDSDNDENDSATDTDTKPKRHLAFGTSVKSQTIANVDTYDSDDEIQENKMQTFNYSLNPAYIVKTHPESVCKSMAEVLALAHIVRDANGNIIDDFHKTEPFLTKYERARLLGQRAQQLADNASPFIEIPVQVMNNDTIATMELQQKMLPFIIERPIPGGSAEYWYVNDLIDLHRS